MEKRIQHNKGFTLIELLIAMAILSIVMLMVVQFMSTTSGSYRKTKKNINVQTEALKTFEEMSDTLMQAQYIRINSKDGQLYEIVSDSKKKTVESRSISNVTPRAGLGSDPVFVTDNYPNYVRSAGDTAERQIIIDYSNYKLITEDGTQYPLTGDRESVNAYSFRMLKQGDKHYYIKPNYIYAEYASKAEDGSSITMHVMYYINGKNIYMCRYQPGSSDQGFATARNKVPKSGEKGLLTNMLKDFYISADADGDSLLTNIMYENDGYLYNSVEPINFRNSNVLSVRPSELYKKSGT